MRNVTEVYAAVSILTFVGAIPVWPTEDEEVSVFGVLFGSSFGSVLGFSAGLSEKLEDSRYC